MGNFHRCLIATAACAAFILGAASALASKPCLGDCDNDGRVGIAELILGVQIASDTQPRNMCPVLDRKAPLGEVTIDELQAAVSNSLNGCFSRCGDRFLQGEEECDGNRGSCPGSCRDDCTCPEPVCGNGIAEAGEICDGDQFNESESLEYQLASEIPLTCDEQCQPVGYFTSYCRYVDCSEPGARCYVFGPDDVGTCMTAETFLERFTEICEEDPFTCEQIRRICERGCEW